LRWTKSKIMFLLNALRLTRLRVHPLYSMFNVQCNFTMILIHRLCWHPLRACCWHPFRAYCRKSSDLKGCYPAHLKDAWQMFEGTCQPRIRLFWSPCPWDDTAYPSANVHMKHGCEHACVSRHYACRYPTGPCSHGTVLFSTCDIYRGEYLRFDTICSRKGKHSVSAQTRRASVSVRLGIAFDTTGEDTHG